VKLAKRGVWSRLYLMLVAALVVVAIVGIKKLTQPNAYQQCVNGLVSQGQKYIANGQDSLPPACTQITPAQYEQGIKQATAPKAV
jgi:hypothetical protein